MLLHQAVPGFAAWFGVKPAVDDALRRFVAADLLTGDEDCRPDRRHRHGQIHRRQPRSAAPASRCSTPMRRCIGCRPRAAARSRRSGRRFPGLCGTAPSIAPLCVRPSCNDRGALSRLEHILHPMVEAEERAFVARARRAGAPAVVLDIPLLFETKGDKRVDTVVVVSAPPSVQLHRVRQRRRMSTADIRAVIARQMPDREKRRRADLVVQTGLSRHHALRTLRRFINGLRP